MPVDAIEASSCKPPTIVCGVAELSDERSTVMRTKRTTFAAMLVAGVVLAAAYPIRANGSADPTVESIRKELLRLPYYGVFDFMSFKVENGQVTLMGYAFRPTLKDDAERALKHVQGVTSVTDQIEELPVSPFDDSLRWKMYDAIYRDPFLSRYAPGGGVLWGHRHPFRSGVFLPLGPARFPGTEPAGDYPIHLVVKNGRVLLLGVVDSDADKTVAGMKAGQVPGSFAVDNELVVERQQKPTTP
jgi:hyperosmotically inducible protein